MNLPGAQLILLRDLGSATEEGLRTDIDKNLQTLGKAEQVEISRWRFESGATLCLIPVGLPDDEDLKGLGIRRHELESHLPRFFLNNRPEKCIYERIGHPIAKLEKCYN